MKVKMYTEEQANNLAEQKPCTTCKAPAGSPCTVARAALMRPDARAALKRAARPHAARRRAAGLYVALLIALAACGDNSSETPRCEELGCTYAEACPATSLYPGCRCDGIACEATPPDAPPNTFDVAIGEACSPEPASLCASGVGVCLEERCVRQCTVPDTPNHCPAGFDCTLVDGHRVCTEGP